MSKVLHAEYTSELRFVLDYLVEAKDFQTWKNRILEQLRSSFRYEGFRPGHVPMEIFLKNTDQKKLESTVVQESVQKYFLEALEQAKIKLKEDDRIYIEVGVNTDPEFTRENQDGTFQFRIILELLPVIDIEGIKNLELEKPTEADLPKRLTLEEFKEREKQNLLKTINQKRSENKQTAFEDLDQAIKETTEIHNQFKNLADFEAFLENTYSQETELLLKEVQRSRLVRAVLDLVPPFSLPEDKVNSEVLRIVQILENQSRKENLSLNEVVVRARIPNPRNLTIKNLSDLTTVIQEYVEDEFRLRWGILRYIYEKYSDQKIDQEQVTNIAEEMARNPHVYAVPKDLDSEEYTNLAYDYLIRVNASRIVESWVTWKEASQESQEVSKKSKTKTDEGSQKAGKDKSTKNSGAESKKISKHQEGKSKKK